MLYFENDYCEGAHEAILKRLMETNLEKVPGYGQDPLTLFSFSISESQSSFVSSTSSGAAQSIHPFCDQAKEKIKEACDCPDGEVYFLVGGTQTNAVVIASVLNRYEGVLSAVTGHVNAHEAGAIEFTGHKVLPLPQDNGKISAADLKDYLQTYYADGSYDHMVFPGMVYISHPTEYGTLYTKQELADISSVCREYEIPLFLDGARLGYGLVAETDVTLKDIANYTDVFYIGGTKVGALCGEAVVFPKKAPKHYLYLEISKNAIETDETKLKAALKEKGYEFFINSQPIRFLLSWKIRK